MANSFGVSNPAMTDIIRSGKTAVEEYGLDSKGCVLLSHRVQVGAFRLGQLSIPLFHFGTASFGRAENKPASQQLRWYTYYVNASFKNPVWLTL